MKLRNPSVSAPNALPHLSHWRNFQVTTLTPIFGGGVIAGQPDNEMPVRAAAIRGQLRFWWRLLHPELTGRRLFAEERKIWGGMSENNQDYASKVKVRVKGINKEQLAALIQPCAEYERDRNRPERYRATPKFNHGIPPYALFPGQGKLNRRRTDVEVQPNNIILPGLTFVLQIECPDDIWSDVEQPLRWWASFGGLGARTRRGLGAVQVSFTNQFPPAEILRPVTQEEASRAGCRLVVLQNTVRSDGMSVWRTVIETLQKFRQAPHGRNPGTPRPGRSRWPEPVSIREITNRWRIKQDGTSFQPPANYQPVFPRAFFGMPIIFHFQGESGDQQADPDDTMLTPTGADRLASPLILKPVALGIGRYAPCALLLPMEHLQRVELTLENSGDDAHNPNLPVSFGRDDWWPLDAVQTQERAAEIRPLQNRNSNPLLAFLDFFERGV